MNAKFLEIRDRGTCIPALAISLSEADGPIARHAGFGSHRCIYLIALATEKASYDPYSRVWSGARTMPIAHQWIEQHYETLTDGQVVDVRVILEEATEPARSDCH